VKNGWTIIVILTLVAAFSCRASAAVGAAVTLPQPDEGSGSTTTASTSDAPRWKGVDETVIEKLANEAGHPPQPPYLDTEQGDLLLFLFLTAGAMGGFIAGYAFRTLFPPKEKP